MKVLPFLSEFKQKLECVQMFYSNNNFQANPSTIAVTSALEGGKLPTPHSGQFTPQERATVPFYRKLNGLQGRSGRV